MRCIWQLKEQTGFNHYPPSSPRLWCLACPEYLSSSLLPTLCYRSSSLWSAFEDAFTDPHRGRHLWLGASSVSPLSSGRSASSSRLLLSKCFVCLPCSYPSGQPVLGALSVSVTAASVHAAASPLTHTQEVSFYCSCSSFTYKNTTSTLSVLLASPWVSVE